MLSSFHPGNYDYLQLHFRFYRYLAFYFLRDFFPCILIVILSWMTFWIDYQSTPARVAMGITTVLTIVTMTNNIRNNSPPAGLFRSIDYYLLMCNLFVFAALAEYALVGHYAIQSNGKRSKGKPKVCYSTRHSCLAQLTRLVCVLPRRDRISSATMHCCMEDKSAKITF